MSEKTEITMLDLLAEIASLRKDLITANSRIEALENHNGSAGSVYLDGVAESYRHEILKQLEEERG